MRSALIIVSFALTLLAAPVPVAEGQAPARRGFTDNATPIETTIDKRYIRNSNGELIGSRDLPEQEAEVEKRIRRVTNARSEEDEVEVEKRLNRVQGTSRSVEQETEEEAEVEKRLNRVQGTSRSVEQEAEEEAEVEKRLNRVQGTSRSVEQEVEEEAEVEKRLNRVQGTSRSVEQEAEEEAEVEKRRNTFKTPIRSVYDGVVGIIEALKTRGFNSANNVPAREPM